MQRDEALPMEATDDCELNPMRHWAYTIRRLRSYPSSNPNWLIYTYYDFATKGFSDLGGHEILDKVRAAVTAIGFDVLEFHAKVVGITNSNQNHIFSSN